MKNVLDRILVLFWKIKARREFYHWDLDKGINGIFFLHNTFWPIFSWMRILISRFFTSVKCEFKRTFYLLSGKSCFHILEKKVKFTFFRNFELKIKSEKCQLWGKCFLKCSVLLRFVSQSYDITWGIERLRFISHFTLFKKNRDIRIRIHEANTKNILGREKTVPSSLIEF